MAPRNANNNNNNNSNKQRPLPLEALQKALAANQSLQAQIELELKRIGTQKAKNRARAAALLSHGDSGGGSSVVATPPLATGKWNDRAYFTADNNKSSVPPSPNDDEAWRDAAEAKSFFASRNPLWTTAERRILTRTVAALAAQSNSDDDNAINWEDIATKVSTATANSTKRTAEECRIEAHNAQKKAPWTAQELAQLRQIMEEKTKLPKEDSSAEKVDWNDVAAKLGTKRTTWDVFQTYQIKIKGKPKQGVWTPEEDELLLKFIAAMGPQYAISNSGISYLATHFLPDKDKTKILARLNVSLVNPKLVNEAWGEEDERRLALCMKVYSESDAKTALYLCGGHIPWRSPGSIHGKWARSLSPAFSVEPFTRKEDEDLLEVMRANPGIGWKDLSNKFFPHRHPHRLMNRFSEIAKDKDILDRYGDELLKRSQPGTTNQTKPPSSDASEYVVKVKRAKRA